MCETQSTEAKEENNMRYMAKTVFVILACVCLAMITLPRLDVSFAEGGSPGEYADIPTLDTEGTPVKVTETDKKNLARLFSAANPSDVLVSFDFEDNIDHTMWVAGFAAWYNDDETDVDPDLLSGDVETHFSGLWDAYFDGWDLWDEAVPPPPNILPYSLNGNVSDSMYYRVKNEIMQSLIKGIYGRMMVAPEEHIRYYDGYFYFGHIGDCEERLWFGYDYTADTVYDLLNGYYKIEGKATLFHYATGEFEESKAYEALVKKDAAADYAYFLLAQRFGNDANPDIVNDDYIDEDEDDFIRERNAYDDGDVFDDDDWFDDDDSSDVYPGMFEDGWPAVYAELNQRMATRTGPGTKYTEDHDTLPQSTEIVVYAQEDSGGTPWVLVEFERNEKLVRAYTGMKRIDVDSAIIQRTTIEPKAGFITRETQAYYGPGTAYMTVKNLVAAGTDVMIYGVDRGYALIDYSTGSEQWMRAWVLESSITYR